ncbi:hypothetical protein [Cryobacterium sp. M15]|uniref:hypothetical protein n=1 Tax=Cryobacterium sp. M15 TaxID=2048291 RepID=UPI000CE52D37|nr:hypothetical protein [Cryobacterium sp. M15]
MRKSSFAALALLGSVALVGATVTPAMAVDETNPKTATIAIAAGALSITSGGSFSLLGTSGAPAKPGTTVTGVASGIVVTDERAGTTGWVASVSMANFTINGGVTTPIPVDAVGTYIPRTASKTDGMGSSTLAVGTVKFGTTPALVQQTATQVAGNNQATWSADLRVAIPGNTQTGSYTSVITHSVLTS